MRQAYSTKFGKAYCTSIEDFVLSQTFRGLEGEVDLILTSPPFPLLSPKAYGNKVGGEYKNWLCEIMGSLVPLLKPRGSLVIEIGNSWERSSPTMSTLPLETLIEIKQSLDMQVCQQFIWNNPSKLPGPASWVNIKRIRVKDSFTHIWWYSKVVDPVADNRKVLLPYKDGMVKLLERQNYNQGLRPSGHTVGPGFLKTNAGAIPSSVLTYANTNESAEYRDWCKMHDLVRHPARMPQALASFFIEFLTEPNSLIFDPFAGSNTTGSTSEILGRRWVAVEKNSEYVEGSKGRFPKFSGRKGG